MKLKKTTQNSKLISNDTPVNELFVISEVEKGKAEKIGILTKEKALLLAKEKDLDLFFINNNVNPPVCKIANYSKYIYAQHRKEKEDKKHKHKSILKEIRFRSGIDAHDLQIKINRVNAFLSIGLKVKVSIRFKRWEAENKENIENFKNKVIKLVTDHGKLDGDPKAAGLSYYLLFVPKLVPKK